MSDISISSDMILTDLRNRLFAASIIAPNCIQLANTKFKKPEDEIWIRESITEGSIEALSNVSDTQICIVNYEVFCPSGLGTDNLNTTIRQIANELYRRNSGEIVLSNGMRISIYKVGSIPGRNDTLDGSWYRKTVTLYVRIYLS